MAVSNVHWSVEVAAQCGHVRVQRAWCPVRARVRRKDEGAEKMRHGTG
jgi:hypothetical protein